MIPLASPLLGAYHQNESTLVPMLGTLILCRNDKVFDDVVPEKGLWICM